MKKDYTSSRSLWRYASRLKIITSMAIFLSLGLSFNATAQLFDVAGTCTMTSTTTYGPMYSTTNASATNRTAVVYPASQLVGIAGQELTSIYFKRGGSAPDPTSGTPNFKLYLKESSITDFGASAVDWATEITGATLVYDSNPLTAMQGGLGWKQIAFSSNFTYSGTNNLIVLMEYVNTGNTTSVSWEYEYTAPCVVTSNSSTTKYINTTTGILGTSLTSQNYRRPHIAFDYTVACSAPTNTVMSGITTTGVTANWIAGGTETNWDYAIQPQGSGVPTTFSQTSTPTLTVNNLSPATGYEFYVRANCGGTNGESVWKGPYAFVTECVVADIPYFEGFETGYVHNVDIDLCWEQTLGAGTKKWTANNTFTTYNRTPRTGDWDATLGYGGNSWMFRGINLTAGTTYLVKFYARQDAATIGGAQISASFGSAPNIASMTSTVVPSTELTLGGYQEMLGFYTPTTSGIYYLGIHGVKTTANWYITLDDISVMVAPTCLSPTSGSVTGTTLTSATVTWTENGSATDWDIEYGLTGFTPTGVPTVSVTSNPAILTNLTANSNYEFYVRSVCSLTDKSTWAGPYSFLTGYCEVSILYTSDHTSSFTTNGALDNVTYTATSNAPGGYSNQLTQTFTSFATQQVNFSHSYVGGGNGLKIWVDWNNDLDFHDAGEELFFLANSNATKTGTFTIPATVAMGDYRMRVRSQYGSTVSPPSCGEVNYGTTIDFNLTIATPPTCLAPTAITGTNITSTSAILAWTENGTSTDWEIQYGTGSFVPTTAPSIAVTTNPYSLTNLQPSSTYRFYVRSRCSATDSSYWAGPFVFTTECGPISAFPWTENFDNMTAVATGVFPLCWVDENPGVWASTNATASTLTSGPLSGPNNIRIRYNSNATIWTPQFDLVAGQTYEFSFSWGGDSYSEWDGGVYVNNTASFASATMLGAKFVENGDPTTLAYRPEIYCFTPTTSGVYTFGIKVIETGSNWYMSFDDFAVNQIVTVPGIDGSLSTCLTGPAVDLNTVITTASTDGSWNFGLNPNAVDTAGLFNTASVPAGVHEFLYITAGCAPDTTIATITVVRPSSAGEDGSLAVCRNQPLNLLQGLTGLADFGGVWTSPNSQVVPNGNTTSSNIPGQYNFQYIVTNGVCPADTANVVVNVLGTCDYLGLEDLAFEAFNMYPNPSSDIVFITNSGSTEVFNYEVLDMNGRVILKETNAINGSTTTELDLRQVEVGVYLVRVFNENADKTFRVVKN